MRNIHFMGLKNELELENQLYDNTNGIQFDEPNTFADLLVNAIKISIPLFLSSLMIVIFVIVTLMDSGRFSIMIEVISIIIVLVFVFVLGFVHEVIHALFLPKSGRKEIYIATDYSHFFVHFTDIVSKKRYILMSVAPGLVLGIPLQILSFCGREAFHPIMVLSLSVIGLSAVMMGIGDYYNTYNAIVQVPKDGQIYNKGWHSYWISKSEVKSNKYKFAFAISIMMAFIGIIMYLFSIELCFLPFYFSIICLTLFKGRVNSIFKWLNLIGMIAVLIY